jgi:hypothetical protein
MSQNSELIKIKYFLMVFIVHPLGNDNQKTHKSIILSYTLTKHYNFLIIKGRNER